MINLFSGMSIHVSPDFYRKAFPPISSEKPLNTSDILNLPDHKFSGIDVFINNHLPQEIKQEVKNDGRFLFMVRNKIKIRKPGKKIKPFTLSVNIDIHALIYDLKNKYEYATITGITPTAPPPHET